MFSHFYPEHYINHIVSCASEVFTSNHTLQSPQYIASSFDSVKWRQLFIDDPTQAIEQLQQAYVLRRNQYNTHPGSHQNTEGIFMTHVGLEPDSWYLRQPRCCEFFNEENLPPFSTWLLVGATEELSFGSQNQNIEPSWDPSQMFLLSWLPSYLFAQVIPGLRQLGSSVCCLHDLSLCKQINTHLTQMNLPNISLKLPQNAPAWESI